MKKLTVLILTTFFMFSCGNDNVEIKNNPGENEVAEENEIIINQRVWVSEFEKALNTKEYILIDLRTEDELKQSWIISEEAIKIDFYSSDFQTKIWELDKEKKYLIYCRSWNRSGQTLRVLEESWFKNVLELQWWIWAWASAWKKFVAYK